jgi:hypothetical protein
MPAFVRRKPIHRPKPAPAATKTPSPPSQATSASPDRRPPSVCRPPRPYRSSVFRLGLPGPRRERRGGRMSELSNTVGYFRCSDGGNWVYRRCIVYRDDQKRHRKLNQTITRQEFLMVFLRMRQGISSWRFSICPRAEDLQE